MQFILLVTVKIFVLSPNGALQSEKASQMSCQKMPQLQINSPQAIINEFNSFLGSGGFCKQLQMLSADNKSIC